MKHRLARSLFLYALCNGWIRQDTTIVEASSGNTAVSGAYFAQMIGGLFIAVMPLSTARSKIIQIKYYGGQCHFVDKPSQVRSESALLANKVGGYFMDQFTYAERATDWRGNNNIAEIIFQQMEQEPILSRTPSSCGLAPAAPRLRSGDIFVIKPIQRNWWW